MITKIEELKGKTIRTVERIRGEWGRTYDNYVCITFTDGTRTILAAQFPYNPDPTVEEMQKAPEFFSPTEIAAKVQRDEERRRSLIRDEKERRRREYEELKKQFGDD